MLRKLFFALSFFPFFQLHAQKIDVVLKNFPIELKNRTFYVSKVLDNRNDTAKIGWSILDKETKGSFYTLKGGASSSIGNYLSSNLRSDSSQMPLVLNLISLAITEHAKGMREGRAKVVVQFLREENGLFGKVYETSAYTESNSEFGKDIYTTHERRVRAVIIQCLKNLSESKWSDVKPDFVSIQELQAESSKLDTISKWLSDTAGMFSGRKKEDLKLLKLDQIEYKGGLWPTFILEKEKHRTLWAFKKHFNQLNDLQTSKYCTDYKAKFKLAFFALGIGAVFIGASFADDSMQDTGLPNLGLAVPGVAFAACSIPIYIKTNKLAKKTIERYNSAIENK